jgi:hypothetical protein
MIQIKELLIADDRLLTNQCLIGFLVDEVRNPKEKIITMNI